MDSIKFYELQKTLKENDIMFCYSGYVTQKILVAIGETIKKKLNLLTRLGWDMWGNAITLSLFLRVNGKGSIV